MRRWPPQRGALPLAARGALAAGAPILCDARMVSEGITRPRLPAGNEVICTLHDPAVPALAARIGNTRSAAAVELWRPHLAGAVVAIGNAPTALFYLRSRGIPDAQARRLLTVAFCREPLLALEDDGLGRFLLDRLDAALAASLGTDPAVDGAQA